MGVKQRSKSLSSSHSDLADTFFQLKVLNGQEKVNDHFKAFSAKVGHPIRPVAPTVFQIYPRFRS